MKRRGQLIRMLDTLASASAMFLVSPLIMLGSLIITVLGGLMGAGPSVISENLWFIVGVFVCMLSCLLIAGILYAIVTLGERLARVKTWGNFTNWHILAWSMYMAAFQVAWVMWVPPRW